MEINFSTKDIENLKDMQSEKEIVSDEEIEELKEMKKTLSENQVNIARLFLRCYDMIEINVDEFKTDENNYTEKIKRLIGGFNVIELRDIVSEYSGGKEYGDYLIEIKIKNKVKENRKKYLSLIKLFFQIFSEE